MKKILICLFITTILCIFGYANYSNTKSVDIDSVLSEYELVSFENLPTYQKNNQSCNCTSQQETIYNRLNKGSKFYKIPLTHTFKKLAWDYHVWQFTSDLPLDGYYYLRLDSETLKVLQSLHQHLDRKGYNASKIRLNYAYRSPKSNERVKGSRTSQHLTGKAMDIVVGDLNRDGVSNTLDKEIVLRYLNTNLNGGVGNYDNSQVIHFDTRGYPARWTSYSR